MNQELVDAIAVTLDDLIHQAGVQASSLNADNTEEHYYAQVPGLPDIIISVTITLDQATKNPLYTLSIKSTVTKVRFFRANITSLDELEKYSSLGIVRAVGDSRIEEALS